MKNQVVITGLGVITPIGHKINDFINNLYEKKSGIVEFEVNSKYKGHILRKGEPNLAGLINDFDITEYFPEEKIEYWGEQQLTVLQAVKNAWKDAEIKKEGRFGSVIIGTAVGFRPEFERLKKLFPAYAKSALSDMPKPYYYDANVSAEFSTESVINAIFNDLEIEGNGYPISNLCTSGATSIGLGYEMIKNGISDYAVCAGFDFFHPRQSSVFSQYNLLSAEPCRPFNKNCTGYQLGEAIGVVILENKEQSNKKDNYGEIKGFGITNEAYHLLIPSPEAKSPFIAMKTALEESGLSINDIDYIAAIGRGSKIMDTVEGQSLIKILKEKNADKKIWINSLVPNCSYTLGASSILNLIGGLLQMKEQKLFPVKNFKEKSSKFAALDFVVNEPLDFPVKTFMSLGSAFLGTNTAMIIQKGEN
jgi:3-oxoacyl-[acyl-carrier-protein] synthase II